MKEFAQLFLQAFLKEGILEEDYIEKRKQRYLEEVERGAVKKVHVDETPKNYGKKPEKKKNKMQRAMQERDVLRSALEHLNDTEN